MKRRMVIRFFGSILIILFAVSCAGAPKPSPEPPVVEVPEEPAPPPPPPVEEAPKEPEDPSLMEPDEASIVALEESRARAEKARKQAFDADGPNYFPQEWKNAEALFLEARDKEQNKNLASYREAAEKYGAAADGYDAVALKSVPLLADKRYKEAEKSRELAIQAGASQLSPERFTAADDIALEAINLYKSGDFYGAAEKATEANARYITLKTGADAFKVRSEIVRKDLSRFDTGNYAAAESKADQAITAYDSGDITLSRNASEEALLRYNLALKKGYELYAGERSGLAVEKRNEALGLKANIAVKKDYDAAATVLTRADKVYQAGDFSEASILYEEAEKRFTAVYESAAIKRRNAQEAMNLAERKILEAEESAKKADSVLQGGAQ